MKREKKTDSPAVTPSELKQTAIDTAKALRLPLVESQNAETLLHLLGTMGAKVSMTKMRSNKGEFATKVQVNGFTFISL